MKTATIDNEAMKKSVQMLVDLYDKYEVGSKDFGTKSEESFGQGQSAMICKWGHNYQYLKTNFPDLEYLKFLLLQKMYHMHITDTMENQLLELIKMQTKKNKRLHKTLFVIS
jgi:ABC-type glycerol-3-phosphate transport system substrate-binding protein